MVESEFEPVKPDSVLKYHRDTAEVVGTLELRVIRNSSKKYSKKSAQGFADRIGND